MSRQGLWKLVKSDYPKLVPILALAFFIAFIPNLNFPYPVHLDEWWHWAYGEAILESGSTTFTDPLLGQVTKSLGSNLEIGFHVFWGVFHGISGIPWITIVRFFPSIVFMLTVLSVYVLAQRRGFGWEAAFFTCLITTTVGIMGPGLFIPVAMALFFAPLSLFILFNFRTWQSLLVIFVLTCFLMTLHPPSAICTLIIIAPFVLINLRYDFKLSLGILLAILILGLATAPWLAESEIIVSQVKSLFVPKLPLIYHELPRVIYEYGIPPSVVCLLGTFLLAVRGGRENYSLVLALLILLLMLATFYTLHYGMPILYLRGLLFVMLVMSIVAGAGLMELRKLELPVMVTGKLKTPLINRALGIGLCLIVISVTLAVAIPDRLQTPYYHMIDVQDYDAFVWVRDNIDAEYKKAILDPWKATAFSAITKHSAYARIEVSPGPDAERAYEFLRNGCADTVFLRDNGISIVYTREDCSNTDLIEVREYVYLLKGD